MTSKKRLAYNEYDSGALSVLLFLDAVCVQLDAEAYANSVM
jgi:hypothetical protein